MFAENLSRNMTPYKGRPEVERRKVTRLEEDKFRELAHQEKARKLHSLLELGQLIGLDLQLNDMLLQIAQKACEVMEADCCSLFLYDIVSVQEDVLTYEYLPGWKRLLKQLEGFFNARWGDYWQKSEAKFWKEFDEKTSHLK